MLFTTATNVRATLESLAGGVSHFLGAKLHTDCVRLTAMNIHIAARRAVFFFVLFFYRMSSIVEAKHLEKQMNN